MVAHFISPLVAAAFAVVYWVIGMYNVMYPDTQWVKNWRGSNRVFCLFPTFLFSIFFVIHFVSAVCVFEQGTPQAPGRPWRCSQDHFWLEEYDEELWKLILRKTYRGCWPHAHSDGFSIGFSGYCDLWMIRKDYRRWCERPYEKDNEFKRGIFSPKILTSWKKFLKQSRRVYMMRWWGEMNRRQGSAKRLRYNFCSFTINTYTFTFQSQCHI